MTLREVVFCAALIYGAGFALGRYTAPANDAATLAKVADAEALADQSKALLERMGNNLKECATQNEILSTKQAVVTELTHQRYGTD